MIRASRFARMIRNCNHNFYSASSRFARITRIAVIRANHATKFLEFKVFGRLYRKGVAHLSCRCSYGAHLPARTLRIQRIGSMPRPEVVVSVVIPIAHKPFSVPQTLIGPRRDLP